MAFRPQGSPIGSSDGDSGGEIMAEINITPLVDVVLVLLIIFMVTSSVMTQMGVEVSLPQANKTTAGVEPDGVIVTLLPEGQLKVNGQKVSDVSAMETRLKESFTKIKSRLVVLEGDRQAFLGSAIQVMDAARRAGADRFAIATSTSDDASR